MNTTQIVADLIKKGATKSTVTVKNITVSNQDSYVRLGISTKETIKGIVLNSETSEYEEQDTNLFFTSNYTIGGILRENEEVAAYVDYLNGNPDFYKMLLSFAKLDVVQEKVPANEEYVNPFNNSDPVTFDHDVLLTHIVNIELGKSGKTFLDNLNKVYQDMMMKKMEAAMLS